LISKDFDFTSSTLSKALYKAVITHSDNPSA